MERQGMNLKDVEEDETGLGNDLRGDESRAAFRDAVVSRVVSKMS
jgi:hypothetical protein